MSINWPQSLRKTMVHYLELTEGKEYLFTAAEKDELVKDLIETYNNLSFQEQANFCVPAKGSFLREKAISLDICSTSVLLHSVEKYDLYELSFNYNWDNKAVDGFVPGTDHPTYIVKGQQYDKVGGHGGRYLCPIPENGEPQSYLARAIPYYVPDEKNIRSSPAYRVYLANINFRENNYYPRIGIISQQFRTNPENGGGVQLVLSNNMSIRKLLKQGEEGETECVLTCLNEPTI